MANGRNLTVYLTSDVSKFRSGLKAAESRMDTFRRRAGTIAKGVGVGLAAGAAAFTAYAAEGVQAAIGQEKANVRLARTLKNLGLDKSTDKVLDEVDAMQKLYGVSEDDLLPAFEKIVGITKDTNRAFDLLQAGMDLAAGTGRPLETVMTAIAKAAGEGGSTGALKRLAPQLELAGIKAGDAAPLLKAINDQFGGQAADQAKTMAGTIDRLGVHLGEVNEALGQGLIDGFLGSMGGADGDAALKNLEGMEDDAKRVGEAFGTLGANALGWSADFINGLEAISLYVDTWSIDTVQKINYVLDALNLISDEEGQRRSDYADQLRLDREAQARRQVTGSPIAPQAPGSNGGDFTSGPTPYYGTSDLYRYIPRKADAAGRADGRAAQKDARTRSRP